MDYAMESVAFGTPVVEVGWIGYQFQFQQNAYDLVSAQLATKAYVINAIATGIVKYIIRRERPKRNYQPRLWNTRITPSFPSGHVAASATFATIASARYPKFTLPLSAFAIISAYSQVYVGNHYVSDVLGGLAIGFLIGKLVLIPDKETSSSPQPRMVSPKPPLNLTFHIPL